MEDIKEKKVKSKTSAKSKSANSVKPVQKKTTEKTKKDSESKAAPKKKVDSKAKVETVKKVKSEKTVNKEEVVKKKKTENTTKKVIKKEPIEELEDEEIQEKIEELEVQEIDIKQIQQEIEEHNKISPVENIKIKRTIIPNIIIALVLTAFYIFIELGFKNIETVNYIVDLKVFSGIFLAISIFLFERSFKNDDSSKTLYGIEMLTISIFNFSLVYLYYAQFTRYEMIVFGFSIFVAVYYIIKSIILYIKKKKEYFFEKSDIKEIISK